MILVIPDTQVKPGVPLDHIEAAGNLIIKEQPETIVIIGDWWDFPSLSFYDKGKASIEGKRLRSDLDSGFDALDLLLSPLRELQKRQRQNRKKPYNPRIVFTEGNHEFRLYRYMEDNPNMVGMFDLRGQVKAMGIEYYDFLEIVDIQGILFSHFFANPMSGRPWGGAMANKLTKIGRSFIQGHAQILEYGERYLSSGEHQFGVVMGAFYMHDERYKGPQGNHHFRGLLKVYEVDGRHDVEFVSVARLLKENK